VTTSNSYLVVTEDSSQLTEGVLESEVELQLVKIKKKSMLTSKSLCLMDRSPKII